MRWPDSSKDRYIFLRADRAVPYGEMMDVLEILRAGGYTKIKLVALEGVPNADGRCLGAGDCKTLRPRYEMSELDIDQKSSRRLWILAAVGALVLHLGCGALAFAHLQGDTGDEYLGAQGEIGIELTSATTSRIPICRPGPTPMRRSLRQHFPSRRPRSRKPTCRRIRRPKPKTPIAS